MRLRFRTMIFVLASVFAYVLLACTAHGADRPRFKLRVGTSAPWLPSENISRFSFALNKGISFDDLIFDQFGTHGPANSVFYGWGQPTLLFFSFEPVVAGGTFPFYGEGGASKAIRMIPWNGSAAVEVARGIWIEAHVASSERRELVLNGFRSYAYFTRVRPTEAITFRPALLVEARHQREDESHVLSHEVRVFGIECVRELTKIGRATLSAGGGVEHWTLTRVRNGWKEVTNYRPFMLQGTGDAYFAAPSADDRVMIRLEWDAPTEVVAVLRPYATSVLEVALTRRLAFDTQVRIYASGARTTLPPEQSFLWGTFSPRADLPESLVTFSLNYTF